MYVKTSNPHLVWFGLFGLGALALHTPACPLALLWHGMAGGLDIEVTVDSGGQ